MNKHNKTIAICGAGIAGVAAAYYLSIANKNWRIVLIDKNQPLSFTTSKSGENFRDYWPHTCMEQLSSRSIELMEQLRNKYGKDVFSMDFSGYHFVSHEKDQPIFADDNSAAFKQKNIVELNAEKINKAHPYLDKKINKSVFIKKAGNIDVYALGSLMIKLARNNNTSLINGEIKGIKKSSGGFKIKINTEEEINADKIIIAAGPFINHIAKMVGLQFPTYNTLQRKFIMPDPLKIIPHDMPFTIYADGQYLNWTEEEKELFRSEKNYHWLLQKFPGAIHIRSEPGGKVKMGWAFQTAPSDPQWETPLSNLFPQVVLKGATRFIPQFEQYEKNIPAPLIEYAGYYTRTKENWPLIGQTELENVYVIGALAGFGTMAACAAGELCANHVFENELPEYADYFHPARYDNPAILNEIHRIGSDGQL